MNLDEARVEQIVRQLEKGESSPMIEDFDPQKHLKEIHNRYIQKDSNQSKNSHSKGN